MLTIVKRLAVPRLAGLKEKWITATAFREKIDTHHRAQTELRVFVKGMRIHAHDPVGRINPIVAAIAAHVGVARKNSAMQHEHVISKHPHVSVHVRGLEYPVCAGAYTTH